jgi:hypothetical protein
VNELHDRGEHFVVAHEMAHHLLGHTDQKHFDFRLHPAASRLLQLRQEMDVHAAKDVWNQEQIGELDADAFAFLALAGEIESPGAFDTAAWYGAMIAALLALPALEDLALAAAAVALDEDQGQRLVRETHPPVGHRVDQVASFVFAFPQPTPANSVPGHPVGLLAQAEVFRYMLAASRNLDPSG